LGGGDRFGQNTGNGLFSTLGRVQWGGGKQACSPARAAEGLVATTGTHPEKKKNGIKKKGGGKCPVRREGRIPACIRKERWEGGGDNGMGKALDRIRGEERKIVPREKKPRSYDHLHLGGKSLWGGGGGGGKDLTVIGDESGNQKGRSAEAW